MAKVSNIRKSAKKTKKERVFQKSYGTSISITQFLVSLNASKIGTLTKGNLSKDDEKVYNNRLVNSLKDLKSEGDKDAKKQLSLRLNKYVNMISYANDNGKTVASITIDKDDFKEIVKNANWLLKSDKQYTYNDIRKAIDSGLKNQMVRATK